MVVVRFRPNCDIRMSILYYAENLVKIVVNEIKGIADFLYIFLCKLTVLSSLWTDRHPVIYSARHPDSFYIHNSISVWINFRCYNQMLWKPNYYTLCKMLSEKKKFCVVY